jgi:phage baseplate assembly protein W
MAGGAGSPFWQARAGALGETVSGLDDIDQAIRAVVTTPPGSVPLEPEFGCALLGYLDLPARQAAPAIVAAVTKALARWEPRMAPGPVIECRHTHDHALRISVSWRPSDADGAGAYTRTEILWA